jgi:pantothenate kinase
VCPVDALCKRGASKYANMTRYPLTMRRILSRYYGTEAFYEAHSAADEYADLMRSLFIDEAAKVLSSEWLKTELFYNRKETRFRIHAAWDDCYLFMTSIPCEHIMGCGCDIRYLFDKEIATEFVARYKSIFENVNYPKITREDNMEKIEHTLRYIIYVFDIKNEIYQKHPRPLTGRGAEFLKAIGLDPYMFKMSNGMDDMQFNKVTTNLALDFI